MLVWISILVGRHRLSKGSRIQSPWNNQRELKVLNPQRMLYIAEVFFDILVILSHPREIQSDCLSYNNILSLLKISLDRGYVIHAKKHCNCILVSICMCGRKTAVGSKPCPSSFLYFLLPGSQQRCARYNLSHCCRSRFSYNSWKT